MFAPIPRAQAGGRVPWSLIALAGTLAIGATWLAVQPSVAPREHPLVAAPTSAPPAAPTAAPRLLSDATPRSVPAVATDQAPRTDLADLGAPSAAELEAFPRPPSARSEEGDAAHLVAFQASGSTASVTDWYVQRLRADRYQVVTEPVPSLVPLGALSFVTPDGHTGSLLVHAIEQDSSTVSVLVVIQ